MSKAFKIVLVVLIITLIVILIFGCVGRNNYTVTVYKESEDFKYLSEETQKILEALNKKYKVDKTYYAKEIISYTDKSVRFIDSEGNEQFISADKIKVTKTD